MAKKARKKSKPAKAAKSKRKPAKAKVIRKAKKAKKATKAKSSKRAPAKAKRGVAKKAKRPAAKKAKRAAPAARKSKDVIGEGNYTASRNFRKDETSFVKKNKAKIPKLAKAAEAALDGPEGAELEAARVETAAHGQE